MTDFPARSGVAIVIRGANMNRIATFAAAAAAVMTFSATSANALVSLGTSIDGGATIILQNSGALGASFVGAIGGFELDVSTGLIGLSPVLLGSSSSNVNTVGTGSLDVYVTRDNIAGPAPTNFLTTFSSNSIPTGWTITLQSIYGGGAWGAGGTQLGLYTNTGPVVGNNGANVVAGPFGGAGPYQVTAHYSIVANAPGTNESNIEILAGVPEPGTWAMMIMGFGAAGAMIRRRRALLSVRA